eukprot:CAMPEP_0174312812 /NCGR_PEP_ID=MMETSP0810-20121108/4537_1 /TAXON_ID=73025 ORGANISM="Eutreptiella gymnastica-like, Strain CCMP1594" /NCGR_SAMPLE_ID=MMETSP0810 /ASSEMBLY_ACC=CAM_ASM_000659 /LENGTH=399 /DNA_ID=CAMNT_0015421325 /DNA_START=370 /DNA_END=1569 /DNA_ORIENTATION=+
MPLDSEKIAAHIANMEQRDQIKDMQTAQVNQALVARGLGHLQQPLPSELKRMRSSPYGAYGRVIPMNMGWQGPHFPQQPHDQHSQAMQMLQHQSMGPGQAPGHMGVYQPQGLQPAIVAYPPTDPPPPLPVSPPVTPEAATEWVLDWGPFKGVIANAIEETTARLKPLRGYKSWTVSNPWKDFIAVSFDSEENAENAAVILRSIAMTTVEGKAVKLEAKTPVPKSEHPQFRPPETSADPPKRDSETMKTAGPDHTGDLTMGRTEASEAAKVTPEAKRYKKPAGDKGKGGEKETSGVSSSASGHPARKPGTEPDGDPAYLPVAAILRFEQIEQAQKLQGEAIEAQGKQLVSLETKVKDTSTQVGLVGSNVKQMLRAQQEQTIKNSREWHDVGEIDVWAADA